MMDSKLEDAVDLFLQLSEEQQTSIIDLLKEFSYSQSSCPESQV